MLLLGMKDIKENNFTKLYDYLQLGGKYTSHELSEEFSLSIRTTQNYLKQLREEYGLVKKKKYYYFTDEYRHIEMNERVQMSAALMISLYKNAISYVEDSVLKNFKQIPKETDAFLFDIDFQIINNETYFNQITHAIIHEKVIHFKYKNAKDKISIKNVYPLKNTNILGYWYLMGYDLDKDKVKTFYFNNIEELVVSKDESYLSLKQIDKLSKKSALMISPWFNDNKKNVKLKINGEAVLYIQRKKNRAFKIIEENQSSILVDMQYYSDIEVLNFVQKWLPHVDIVDNDELKIKLHARLKEYLLK